MTSECSPVVAMILHMVLLFLFAIFNHLLLFFVGNFILSKPSGNRMVSLRVPDLFLDELQNKFEDPLFLFQKLVFFKGDS